MGEFKVTKNMTTDEAVLARNDGFNQALVEDLKKLHLLVTKEFGSESFVGTSYDFLQIAVQLQRNKILKNDLSVFVGS